MPDPAAFLDAAGLKSEARMSALEFERQRAMALDLRSVLARGWRHLLHVYACVRAQTRRPSVTAAPATEIAAKVTAVVSPKVAPVPQMVDPFSYPATVRTRPAQGMRMRL